MATLFENNLSPDILAWLAGGKQGQQPGNPMSDMPRLNTVSATQPAVSATQPAAAPPTQYGFGPERNFFPDNAIPADWFNTPYGPETMSKPQQGGGSSSGVFGGSAANNLFSAAAGGLGGWALDGEGAGVGGALGGLLGGPGGAMIGGKLGSSLLDAETMNKVKGWLGLAGEAAPPAVGFTEGGGPLSAAAYSGFVDPSDALSGGGGITSLLGGSGSDTLGGPTRLIPDTDAGLFSDANLGMAGDAFGVAAGLFNAYNAFNDPNAGTLSSAALSVPSTIQSGANLLGIGGAGAFPATLGGSAMAASAAAAAPALVFAGFNHLANVKNNQSGAGNTVLNWTPGTGWEFAGHGFDSGGSEEGFRTAWSETQQAAHLANELAKAYGLESDHDSWQRASGENPYGIYGIGNADPGVPGAMPSDARGWLSNVFSSGMYRSSDPNVQNVLDQMRANPGAAPEQIIEALETARPGAAQNLAPFDAENAPGVHGWTGPIPTRGEGWTSVTGHAKPDDGGDWYWDESLPDNVAWRRMPLFVEPGMNVGP